MSTLLAVHQLLSAALTTSCGHELVHTCASGFCRLVHNYVVVPISYIASSNPPPCGDISESVAVSSSCRATSSPASRATTTHIRRWFTWIDAETAELELTRCMSIVTVVVEENVRAEYKLSRWISLLR